MIEQFLADMERLLWYLDRIEGGELTCIDSAERLVKAQGLCEERLGAAIQTGVDAKLSLYLRQIKEKGEDIEFYTGLIQDLTRQFNLDQADLEDKTREAIKEAEVRRYNYYVNMIENENIHFVEKARAIQRKYGLEGKALEEAIGRGEYGYLFHNMKQIRKGPRFHPLLPREEDVLRGLAEKYGYEEELEEAIEQWRALGQKSQR